MVALGRWIFALEEVQLQITHAQPAHREGEAGRGYLLHLENLFVEARRFLKVVGVDADVYTTPKLQNSLSLGSAPC